MTLSVFAAVVALIGIYASRTGLLRWQVLFCILGGTTALALPALGGATIVVPAFCLPFLVARAALERHGSGAALKLPKSALWLASAVLWGLVITLIMPRLFAGQTEIIGIDRFKDEGTRLAALGPVSGNVSQSAFAIMNVATFIAGRYLLRFEHRVAAFRDAMLLLATLNCAAAFLNIAEHYLHLPSTLSHLRTAYKVYETYEHAGVVRIHGTFPETSVFAVFSLTLLGYTLHLWMSGVRPMWSGTVSVLLLSFLALSTSGTAYAGLAIYGTLWALPLIKQAFARRSVPRAAWLVTAGLGLATIALALVVFQAPLVDRVTHFFEVTVFDKLSTKSGETRSLWNRQAWQNFLDTYGLGVGFGTARPSSFFLVLLSNIGAVGTIMYGLFLYYVLKPPPKSDQASTLTSVSAASRQAILAALSAAVLSGSSFDRGALFYLLAAAASRHSVDPSAGRKG